MKRKASRCRSEINVTPYIDILLVLLIVFMVIQPTTEHDLRTRVPGTPDSTHADNIQSQIVVDVTGEGRVTVNRQEVDLPQLGSRLFEILSSRGDKRLFIRGAAELPFGDIARVIDIAKGAGAGDIGLL